MCFCVCAGIIALEKNINEFIIDYHEGFGCKFEDRVKKPVT